ncbi:hypothetical protein BDN71DRAFT_1433125 [Pleurotus eryngii]|uniref:Uncharacterized protein n=1 Tax=Pleurotus eryngii TaxID=5323 RepID=A0A9P5ZQS1_PLEER|nr:hypothetical protein BDN71DRAFT_1433125 [Pleurotus eryngii]
MNAMVKQDCPEHCPVITSECITPEILCHFENAVTTHFRVKNIPEERWVSTVAFNMEDLLVIDWLTIIGSKLLHICLGWLKKDWKHMMHHELFTLEQGLKSFEDFTFKFRLKNALLINTSSQLDEMHTHHQLESHMEKELAMDCAMVKLYLVNDFDKWLEAVTDLDEKRQHQLAIIAKELAHRNDRYPPHASILAVTPTALCVSMTTAVKDVED